MIEKTPGIEWVLRHERVFELDELRRQAIAITDKSTRPGSRSITPKITLQELAANLWRMCDQLEGYKTAMTNITADAPNSGTETSRKAARSIKPIMSEQRLAILGFIARSPVGSITADAIEQGTGMTGNSIRPRLTEMATLGWVRRTDETRKTRSGRDANVWETTNAGVAAYLAKMADERRE